LASSSERTTIATVLGRVGLAETFAVVVSGDDVEDAKPDPAIYLEAAARLRVTPAACLALEDSAVGVMAAKAAGMRCVAVPETFESYDPRLEMADTVLASLADLDDSLLEVRR
jgi:sugar-phosphatase